MTIVNQSIKRTVQGNGAQSVFDYNFWIPSSDAAELYFVDNVTGAVALVPASTWGLSGVNNPLGGTFTYPLGAGPALASTQSLTLVRKLPYTQLTSLQNQSGFQPRTIERALDTIVIQLQQAVDGTARALRAPSLELGFPELPNASLRKNKILSFDVAGNPSLLPLQPDNNTTVIAQGTSTPRSVSERFADRINVKDYGASGAGILPDGAAIAAAFVARTEIYFPAGNYLVGGDLTIPAGKVVWMDAQAVFVVAPGVTLTIYAQFNGNPDSHHFQGAGSVIGIGEAYPEWFGALGDSTTDDAAAFNKTIPCVKASLPAASNGVVRLQGKSYLLNSSWVVEQTANAGVDIIGTGTLLGDTRLLGGASFTDALVNIQGNTNPLQSIVDFKLSGFALISQNVGQGQGLVFNTVANNRLNGLQKSLVENIHIDGFKQGIVLRNSRLLKFSRMSVWNNRIDGTLFANANWCVIVTDGGVGQFDFCGDFTFDSCNFVTNKQFYSKIIQINGQSPNSASPPTGKSVISVAGIRFTECIFYNGGNFSAQITATNYAQIADIWFTNCQFDDTTGLKVDTASVNALITDINYQGNYHTRVEGNCVRLDGSIANGRINSISIINNYCAGVVNNAAVDASGVDCLNVVANRWSGVDWPVGAALNFINCNQLICNDNNFGRAGPFVIAGSFNNMVSITGTGNYYVVTGNNSASRATGTLINNTTGAANTAIANNI